MDFEQEELASSNDYETGINLFRESFDAVKKRIESLRNEKESYWTSNAALVDRLRKAEIAVKDAEAKLNMKCKTIDICDKETVQLRALLDKANSENFKMCSELCKLEYCLEEKKERIDALQKELDTRNLSIEELETGTDKMSLEKLELIKSCKDLEEKIIEKTREVTSLLLDREREQRKIADMKSKYNDASKSVDVLSKQVREQRANTEMLQEKFQSSQIQLAEVSIQNKEYREKMDALETRNSELNQTLNKLAEVERNDKQKQMEINFLEKRVTDMGHEIKGLRQTLSEERSLRIPIESLLSATEEKLREVTQKQETAESEIERFREKCDLAEEKSKEMEILLRSYQNQFEASETNYRDVIEKLQLTISELRTELKSKSKDVLDLQKDQLSKEFELREFERINNEKEKMITYKSEALESLTKRNEELKSEIAHLRAKRQGAVNNQRCKENSEEGFVINHMLTQLSLSKQKYANNREHQKFIRNHCLQRNSD